MFDTRVPNVWCIVFACPMKYFRWPYRGDGYGRASRDNETCPAQTPKWKTVFSSFLCDVHVLLLTALSAGNALSKSSQCQRRSFPSGLSRNVVRPKADTTCSGKSRATPSTTHSTTAASETRPRRLKGQHSLCACQRKWFLLMGLMFSGAW